MLKPPLGISILIHGLVIYVHNLRRNKPMRWASIVIFMMVVGVVGASATTSTTKAIDSDTSNIHWAKHRIYKCKELEKKGSKNKIVLRVDDYQAFAMKKVSILIVEEAIQRNMPLVAGVIPKGLESDKKMYYFLKKHSCHIEIAQHGWDHNIVTDSVTPEFEELDYEQAADKILPGKELLDKLSKTPVTTFIPPNNVYSKGTAEVMKDQGFKIVSSEGDEEFDYDSSTYDFDTFEVNPVNKVLNDCEKGLKDNNVCIIMLHPQDYMTDGDIDYVKFQLYIDLLERIEKADVSVVTFQELVDKNHEFESKYLKEN